MVDFGDPTLERETLGESTAAGFEQGGLLGGVGGALQGLGSLFLPRAGLPGQRDLGSILTDFVEFSRLGDIGDIGAALDPDSGLDGWERLIAASPFIGVGALGVRKGYRKLADNRQLAIGRSMLPAPGQSYDLTSGWEDLGGLETTPVQSRQQQAHFQQLAFESTSPLTQAALRAESWEELGVAFTPGNLASRREDLIVGARAVGAAVTSIVPDPTIYGADVETQQFVAAKIALTKFKRALELGILENEAGRDANTQLWLDLVGQFQVENIVAIAQLEAATSGVMGPDLTMPSPGRLGRVWFDENGEPQVAVGLVDGLLPTERVFDWGTAYPLDPDRIRSRQQQLDWEAVQGIGASNIAKAFMQNPPEGHASAETWYRNFNRSARVLSEATGYTVHQVAGVVAAMSANAPWLPANLVGAVHVVLQTGRPDLMPGTPEYVNVFREATIGSGWEWDMYDESSADLRGQFGPTQETGFAPNFEGLSEFYADPTNVTSPEGRLPALDNTKQEKVDLILKGNLPPWLVLRGMKTNTFGWLGSDPSLMDLVVVDTWNDRVFWGTLFTGTPLAFDGYTTKVEIDPDATYFDPVSGDSVSGSTILPRIAALAEEHGWTEEQVRRWKSLLTAFPTKTAQARFLAQAKAHLLVRDEFGMPSGHSVQAPTWLNVRTQWDGLTSRITGAMTREELHQVAREAHLDTTFFTHLEGNPQMERTAAGMVWNVSDTLSGALPPLSELKATQSGMQRDSSGRVKSSIVTVRTADGKVRPFVDSRTPGVLEVMRHASPTGLKVGDYDLFVANKARQVLSVEDHIAEVAAYRRADGRQAAGYATVAFDPEGPGHPGMIPGERVVVIVPQDSVGQVKGILETSYPADYRVVNTQTHKTAAARNKVGAGDIRDLADHQLAEILQNNDWVAITAYRSEATPGQNWDAQRRLKLDIERAGGEVVEAEGRYPGEDGVVDEPSFFVTGLTYKDALRLAQKYNQEAVATRYGMINTDGTYYPVQDKVVFGEDVDADSHTRLGTGQKFSFDYDWDNALPLPEEIDTLADVGINSEPMAQVVVDLGGDYGGASWADTDRMMERLSALPGARLRLYTHSLNKVPAGFTKAVESVFTDPTGVSGSVLHRAGDTYARHHADVWVPEWETFTLSEDGFTGERANRSPVEAREIMEIDQEGGMIWFDKDLAIQVEPQANVTMAKSGPVFRSLTINGKKVRSLVVDTNGPVPILVAGAEGPPAPGRTVIELTNGEVSKIVPHLETDWGPAKDALAGAGLIPEGKTIDVHFPEADLDAFPGQVTEVAFNINQAFDKLQKTQPSHPADVDTTRIIQEKIETIQKVRLGMHAPADLHRQTQDVLLGLHGHSDLFPGVKLVGAVPDSVWKTLKGIDIMNMPLTPETDAVTIYNRGGGIILNERSMFQRWNRGTSVIQGMSKDFRMTHDRFSDFQITLVHETGHVVEAKLGIQTKTMRDLVTRTMDELGHLSMVKLHLSRYALQNNSEFFAEAFTQVMMNGERAHPALVKLVKDVMMIVNANAA